MENQALKAIKTYRSTGMLVFLIIFSVLSTLCVVGFFIGNNHTVFNIIVTFLALIITCVGWERRYTAIHNPQKIYKEINK